TEGLPGGLLIRKRRGVTGREPQAAIVIRRGPIPALAPRIAAVVIERAAEDVCGPRKGATALGQTVAAALLKHDTESGADKSNLNRWTRTLALASPDSLSNLVGGLELSLRDWLFNRWQGAYRTALEECHRDWPGFIVETAHNPFATFGPLADVEAVSLLYN